MEKDLSLRHSRNLVDEKMIRGNLISNTATDELNKTKSNENKVIGLDSNVKEVSFNCYLHLDFNYFRQYVNYCFTKWATDF